MEKHLGLVSKVTCKGNYNRYIACYTFVTAKEMMTVDNGYVAVVAAALGLPETRAKVAALLLKEEAVTRRVIDKALGLSPGGGRAYVMRLRSSLEKLKVSIHFSDGFYYFDDDDRKTLLDKVARFNH